MRKYYFELVINEGDDEFWEGYGAMDNEGKGSVRGYATCEEVEELVSDALKISYIYDFDLILRKYTNDQDANDYTIEKNVREDPDAAPILTDKFWKNAKLVRK